MTSRPKLWHILLTGLIAEIVLSLVAIPFAVLLPDRGASTLPWVIPPAGFVVMLIAGYWLARRCEKNFALIGALVGAVAALVYISLTWGRTLPMAYDVAHVLKVVGGALGGWLAGRSVRARQTIV